MAKADCTSLPPFVVARNEIAMQAGLRIAKQERSDNWLRTWYVGTESQFRATQLVRKPRINKPSLTFPSRGRRDDLLQSYSPGCWGGTICWSIDARENGEFRATITKEPFPQSWRQVSQTIEQYDFEVLGHGCDGPAEVFVGAIDDLVRAGIVPKDLGPGCKRYKDWSNGPILWEAYEMDDGRLRFARYLDAEAQGRKLERASKKVMRNSADTPLAKVSESATLTTTMGNVIRLVHSDEQDTAMVKMLKKLLQKARSGEIDGIAFVSTKHSGTSFAGCLIPEGRFQIAFRQFRNLEDMLLGRLDPLTIDEFCDE